ncbi:hypothetical protein JTB14_035875 [Gonioctena quinquepunctata]|nr:hypothetical protein JTB14_035875 [Gonioctena quinquepunctata]
MREEKAGSRKARFAGVHIQPIGTKTLEWSRNNLHILIRILTEHYLKNYMQRIELGQSSSGWNCKVEYQLSTYNKPA